MEQIENAYYERVKGKIMAYKRKTIDRWDILGNCGYGWEVENSEYTRAEAKRSLKEYRENCDYPIKMEKHREKIDK